MEYVYLPRQNGVKYLLNSQLIFFTRYIVAQVVIIISNKRNRKMVGKENDLWCKSIRMCLLQGVKVLDCHLKGTYSESIFSFLPSGQQVLNMSNWKIEFSNFSCMFLNPNNFNCSNLLYMRNLQEQVKKAFCYS